MAPSDVSTCNKLSPAGFVAGDGGNVNPDLRRPPAAAPHLRWRRRCPLSPLISIERHYAILASESASSVVLAEATQRSASTS